MPTKTCRVCGVAFDVASKKGRAPAYCSQECRKRKDRAGLADSFACLTCGKEFRPMRPRGVVQRYCRRLCNPKYGWTCTVCGALKDAGAHARVQTVADAYVCNPCRGVADRGMGLRKHRPAQLPKEPRPCHYCGTVFTPTGQRRKFCSDECFRKTRNGRGSGGKPKRKTTERGYGSEHQRLRRELLPFAWGQPCAICLVILEPGDDVHLDHTEDRSGYRGFSHAWCNLHDGAKRGAARSRMAHDVAS